MWIFLALASRFLWSFSNAMDQVLSRAHKDNKTAAVTVLVLCMNAPLGILSLAYGGLGRFDPVFLSWIALGVIASLSALLPYFKCLQKEEAYNIVPYMEMTPVFVTLMAFLFHDARLTTTQLIGTGLIILCGFLFSWDFTHGKFKARVFLLMALCSFCMAVGQIALNAAESGANVWSVMGYLMVAESIVGWVALATKPQTRRSIVEAARSTKGRTLALTLLSNVFAYLGLAALLKAFVLAPTIGHAAGLSGVQPFFSFFLAAMLGRFVPAHFERVPFDGAVKVKLGLLLGILGGVWLLVRG